MSTNIERCLSCDYAIRKGRSCGFINDVNFAELGVCPAELIKKHIKDSPAETFIKDQHGVSILRYLSYLRKDKLPKVGDKVLTLRSGFGGYAFVIRFVRNIEEGYIYLTKENGEDIYVSDISNWHKDLFVLENT